MNETTLSPGVSVVVCCHNSADVIGPTIRALARQAAPAASDGEVILVDNNCSDGTVSLAREAWRDEKAKHSLRIVEESSPGLIHARRKGVLAARYDILLFVDDDNIVAEDGVPVLLSLYRRQPQAVAIGGRVEPLFAGEKPPWFDLVPGAFACTPTGPEADQPGIRLTVSGAGLSFRTRFLRSIFTSSLPLFLVGRKDEAFSRGEDSEICLRMRLQGGELRYEPSFRVRHFLRKDRLNWDYVLQARHWYGKAEVILKIYKDRLKGQAPLAYEQRLWQAEENLKKFQAGPGDDQASFREGSPPALKRSYLLGQRAGLLEIGRDEFERIREAVTGFFPASVDDARHGPDHHEGDGREALEDQQP